MVKAVIFDVDGTLVDSVDQHARSWQEAFSAFGHDIPFSAIRAQIGKGGDQLMPVFLSRRQLETIGPDLEKLRSDILKDRYFSTIKGFPMVRALFERLRADNIRIVLASSAKANELSAYQRLADIEDLVDAATTSDETEKSKPFPDIFQAAMDKLPGIQPSDVVVIGDTPYDAQAAGKAGLATVGVLCGGFAEKDLRDANCVAIYASPADILQNYDNTPLSSSRI